MPLATLVLYVNDRPGACEEAIAKVEHVIRRLFRDEVVLTIRNLSRVERIPEDRTIVVVPTLVMTSPRTAYLIGTMEEEEVLRFLAEYADLRRDGGTKPR